jgi:hypothetical protein
MVLPDTETEAPLADALFVDAYQLVMEGPTLSAPIAEQRILGRAPSWVNLLITLRNRVVAPLGLKTPSPDAIGASKQIGIFPVLSQTPDRVILGLDHSPILILAQVKSIPAPAPIPVQTGSLVGMGPVATSLRAREFAGMEGQAYQLTLTQFGAIEGNQKQTTEHIFQERSLLAEANQSSPAEISEKDKPQTCTAE